MHRRRRKVAPGVAIVYRDRRGHLSEPSRGYTPGELWWLNPREAYEIDMTEHACEVDCNLAITKKAPTNVALRFAASWQVINPVAVVEARLADVHDACEAAAEAWCHESSRQSGTMAEQVEGLRHLLPVELSLTAGVLLRIHALVGASINLSREEKAAILRLLLGENELVAWTRDSILIRQALASAQPPDGTKVPTEVVDRALTRFAALIERLGDLLPEDSEALDE
jgi:hypothetical protein